MEEHDRMRSMHSLLREFRLFFSSLSRLGDRQSKRLFQSIFAWMNRTPHVPQEEQWQTLSASFLLPLGFVVLTAFFTYVVGYNAPSAPFWDEPYHIASAQKYLHGVHFMEQHPPLGKLFIALGEKLLHPNENTDQFLGTDYARDFAVDSSFAGYRLFPTLFGFGSAIVFFFLFLTLTKNPTLSALFSFLYIFDNAQIVHSRGAMLDSTLLFFALLTLLIFFLLQKTHLSTRRFIGLSLLFGASFACALTTKVVALVLLVLVPFFSIVLFPDYRRLVLFCATAGMSFVLLYSSVWMTHFALGSTIVSNLPDQGYYQASPAYKDILATKSNRSLLNFPIMLRDSLRFVSHYNNGVPRLDLCKADENGSPSFFWPFGGRTINYRWAKDSADASLVSYLYLVPNPVGWLLGLLGVLFSLSILFSALTGERKQPILQLFPLCSILALYLGYMIAISTLDRVMYLYHYFFPLACSYLLFALSLINIHQLGTWKIDEERRIMMMTFLGLAIFLAFQFMRPLSYYLPLSSEQVQSRSLLPLWELTCVGCMKENPLTVPNK
jgi:dolichyl-phosphate-mannose-protein mannosyltransferase